MLVGVNRTHASLRFNCKKFQVTNVTVAKGCTVTRVQTKKHAEKIEYIYTNECAHDVTASACSDKFEPLTLF